MVTRLFKKIVELTKMTTSTTLLCIKKILESVIIKVFGCLKKKGNKSVVIVMNP